MASPPRRGHRCCIPNGLRSFSRNGSRSPLQLIWQKNEWVKMLISFLLMGLPFFLAGGIVGMILTAAGEKAHLMYGADLMGAGCGALAVIPALYLGPPWALLPVLGGVVLLGGLGCCRGMPLSWEKGYHGYSFALPFPWLRM